jgi:CRP/FNR family transcriptional regulator, anaerobic regulatory protein
MEPLTDYIKTIVPISDNELIEIRDSFKSKILEKGTFLLKAGQYCDCYYFVANGTLRIYTVINDQEITGWFAFRDYFFTELESYVSKSQTRFNIQVIEKSEVFYIQRKSMDVMSIKYPKWNVFVRKIWELSFIKLQQVALSFQTKTASERYEDLFNHPHFIQKTKQRDLASMLGITKSSLSRLRRKR